MDRLVALAVLTCIGLAVGLNVGARPTDHLSQDWLCRNHTPVVGLYSTYDGKTRVISALCLPPSETANFSPASSSSYHTTHRRDTTTGCANTTLISGLQQLPSGVVDIFCSELPDGYSLDHCSWSRWLNKPSENFSVPMLPVPWVMRSVISRRLDQCDWRYKLELCQLTSSPLSSPPSGCHIPSVAHGSVRYITHTHSITQDNTPFEIKISLTCDPGYYWDETDTMAVCENGTWTHLPNCAECKEIDYCVETVCSSSTDSICLRCQPTLPDGLPLVISKSGRRCRAVPVISTGPLMVGFVAGSNLTLDCVAKGRPTPSKSWHRVLLPSGDRVPLLDHTHFVPHKNGSLTVVNITDMDSGPYVCRAWNAAGSDIVYIDVYNGRPDHTGPPSIYHWSPLHVVSPEHLLTSSHLHCHVHGFPPPTITWSLSNITTSHHHTLTSPPSFHPITSPTVYQYRNGTLAFNPVRNVDTALYHCEAANVFGTVSMETILFIDTSGGDRPAIFQWSTNYTAAVGDSLHMTCSTSHQLLWMKKGGLVPMSGTRIWQNGNGTLTFEIVLAEDMGPYWCVVWDSGGVAMEMTELIVVEEQPIISGSSIPQVIRPHPLAAALVTWLLHNML